MNSLLVPDINFKHKFVLNKNNIIILCLYFQEQYKDIKLVVKESPNKNSNSFYMYFYIGELSTCLRISDHHTKLTAIGGGIRNIIVGKGLKYNDIYTKMCDAVRCLKNKKGHNRIEDIFKEIKSDIV